MPTDAEMVAAIEALPAGCCDAIEAAMELVELVAEHNLTLADLTRGFRLAISGGHEVAMIVFQMASRAVTTAQVEGNVDAADL